MASANEHTVETAEFPICFTEQAEASTISIAGLKKSKKELLKVKAELSLTRYLKLFQLKIWLTVELRDQSCQSKFTNDPANVRQKFQIHGATGSSNSEWLFVDDKIKIGNWYVNHNFVISHSVTKHDAILGRGFLKQHKVTIDHSTDSISIGQARHAPKTIQSTPSDKHSLTRRCTMISYLTIAPNSQSLVECSIDGLPSQRNKFLMLEPTGTLIARSLHIAYDTKIFCIIVNATDHTICLA